MLRKESTEREELLVAMELEILLLEEMDAYDLALMVRMIVHSSFYCNLNKYQVS
jgi:hypothetical protein